MDLKNSHMRDSCAFILHMDPLAAGAWWESTTFLFAYNLMQGQVVVAVTIQMADVRARVNKKPNY